MHCHLLGVLRGLPLLGFYAMASPHKCNRLSNPLQLCAYTPGVSCTALSTDLLDERSMLTPSCAAHRFHRMGQLHHVRVRHACATL